MARIRRSWQLAKTSWGVVRTDPELLWLPVLSALCVLAVGALFVVPILLGGRTDTVGGGTSFEIGPLGYVLAFVGYVAVAYVGIYFRAALMHGADVRLQGGDPTLRDALRGASARAGRLLPWAIVATTVSLVLRAIEERAGLVGRIVGTLVGLAWALVTFLVLPVILVEDLGPLAAVRRSAELFKHTWGEQVAANVGFGIVGIAAILPAVLVGGLLAATGVLPLVVLGVGAAIAWVVLASVVLSALGGVFQMALYRYAVEGVAPGPFSDADLGAAFAPRRRRGGMGF